MMRKYCIRNIVWLVCMWLFMGGCGYGGQGQTIVIGSGEGQESTGAVDASGTSGKGSTAENGVGSTAAGGGQSGAEVQPGAGMQRGADEKPGMQEEMIRVYVCGAVASPGVVSVPAGSRVEDALAAAGGFGEEAGRDAVNLADWVTDGQMLYFPTEEEAGERKVQEAVADSGLVNINTADAALLCTLPGIGESRAADIISYREKNGAFENCEDIMKVSGIKASVYEKIREKITVK